MCETLQSITRSRQKIPFKCTASISSCATFTYNTMRIDQWVAVFGPDDIAGDQSKQNVGDLMKGTRLNKNAGQQQASTCSPNVCNMSSPFCVDCCYCSRHCICDSEELLRNQVVVAEPPVCDPVKDCVCNWECQCSRKTLLRPIENKLEDANAQSNKKKRIYSALR